MGHIKEPKGVDLVIQGRLLSKKEEEIISDFIKADKVKTHKRKTLRKSKRKIVA